MRSTRRLDPRVSFGNAPTERIRSQRIRRYGLPGPPREPAIRALHRRIFNSQLREVLGQSLVTQGPFVCRDSCQIPVREVPRKSRPFCSFKLLKFRPSCRLQSAPRVPISRALKLSPRPGRRFIREEEGEDRNEDYESPQAQLRPEKWFHNRHSCSKEAANERHRS